MNRLARWQIEVQAGARRLRRWGSTMYGHGKATVSLFVISALLTPSHTAGMIKVLSPSIQTL